MTVPLAALDLEDKTNFRQHLSLLASTVAAVVEPQIRLHLLHLLLPIAVAPVK